MKIDFIGGFVYVRNNISFCEGQKVDFIGGSVYVRNKLSFREGQKVVTENGVELKYHSDYKKGNIRWFNFQDKDGNFHEFRMMAFPYMHSMRNKIEKRDNLGPIDIRVSMLKSINRELVKLLK